VLSVGDRVRSLLGRYCDLVDSGDWDGVGALFAGGRLTSGGTVLAEGAEAVSAFYAGGTQLHGGSPRTKHVVANTQLDAGADGAIVARSSFVVLQAVEGVLALQPVIAGRYVDTFEVDADVDGEPTWRERSFEVDLTGDLSHHLTWALPDR
jgi:3-phenylpropionate/cinnamic acid dioxygenase small subunit